MPTAELACALPGSGIGLEKSFKASVFAYFTRVKGNLLVVAGEARAQF